MQERVAGDEGDEDNVDLRAFSHSELLAYAQILTASVPQEVARNAYKQAHSAPAAIHKRRPQAQPGVKVQKVAKIDTLPLEAPSGETSKKVQKQQSRPRREGRAFDVTQCCRRYITLRVAYLGEKYNGFALQPNVPDTIEVRLSSWEVGMR